MGICGYPLQESCGLGVLIGLPWFTTANCVLEARMEGCVCLNRQRQPEMMAPFEAGCNICNMQRMFVVLFQPLGVSDRFRWITDRCGLQGALHASTLHFRGKNGTSKNIGQTTQKISHFIPNMYVSGKISALRPCTHIVRISWN